MNTKRAEDLQIGDAVYNLGSIESIEGHPEGVVVKFDSGMVRNYSRNRQVIVAGVTVDAERAQLLSQIDDLRDRLNRAKGLARRVALEGWISELMAKLEKLNQPSVPEPKLTDSETATCRNCGAGVFRLRGRDLEWMNWLHTGAIYSPRYCLDHTGHVAVPAVAE